jgi:FAD synthase
MHYGHDGARHSQGLHNLSCFVMFAATGDEAMTVEVHVLHKFAGGEEFYGNNMRVVACGYLRPEQRFPGLPALLNRIRTDIGLARVALDAPSGAALRSHPSFVQR